MEPKPAIDKYFEEYAQYHQTRGNKITHYIGIPLITWSLLGLLSHIVLFEHEWSTTSPGFLMNSGVRIDLGLLLWLGTSIWYVGLDRKLGLLFSFLCLGMLMTASNVDTHWLLGSFALGWAIQYFGHLYYEKKSPAFQKNLIHLLVGPFWLFSGVVWVKKNNNT
jgi:uncharacterized membrane protein YGL010W